MTLESAADAVAWTTCLTAISVALLATETLADRASHRDTGLLGLPVAQTRHPWLLVPWVERAVVIVLGYRALLTWTTLRLLAALALIALPLEPASRSITIAFLAGSSLLLGARTGFGMDGADQMTTLVLLALAVDALVDTPLARQAALWFIAAELALSYAVAGTAKLLGPEWRSGRAIWGVLSTRMYGVPPVGIWLRDRPWLSKLICWSVILGEGLFPLVFVVPPPVGWVLIAAGLSFHLGTALLMGLNTFLWAFLACYPALLWCAFGGRVV